jgi:hypothetical protein
VEVCGVLLFLFLSAAPLLELEAERHPRGDVVEGQRIPVLQHIANPLPVAGFRIRIRIQRGQWF